MSRARFGITLMLAVMLAGCQTMGHRFSRTQEAALRANGFVEANEGWELSMADRVLFDVDSDALKSDMRDGLGRVATSLLRVGISRARVEGHTDSTGTSVHNLSLSIARARAVSEALETSGFSAANLSQRGWGETHPVGDNATEEGRALNRRVVIIVTPD